MKRLVIKKLSKISPKILKNRYLHTLDNVGFNIRSYEIRYKSLRKLNEEIQKNI